MSIEDGRYEIKFVTNTSNFFNIINWVKLHKSCFYSPYPDREINNIYFDKYNYFAYSENLSGTSERNKVRYRWYGNNNFPVNGKLEVKRRRNFYGWKESFPVKNHPDYAISKDSMNTFKRHLENEVNKKGKFWIQNNPHPTMLNRYDRKYFISDDNNIRLTVDSNLKVFDQRYKSFININQKANIPETIIVEFKCDRNQSENLSKAIEGIPIRVSRNSKYINAMRSIHRY